MATKHQVTYREPGPGRVRCLGPREPIHWFVNRGNNSNRVCSRCRERINELPWRAQVTPNDQERDR